MNVARDRSSPQSDTFSLKLKLNLAPFRLAKLRASLCMAALFGRTRCAVQIEPVPTAPIHDLCRNLRRHLCRKMANSTMVATKVATKSSVRRAFGTGSRYAKVMAQDAAKRPLPYTSASRCADCAAPVHFQCRLFGQASRASRPMPEVEKKPVTEATTIM